MNNKQMNPYVENLVQMGYDRSDCETVAVAGVDKTFPLRSMGESIKLKKSMIMSLHDFLNGQ